MQKLETITATGTTDAITLNNFDRLTFASTGDATDYTLTAEVQLVDDSRWYPAQIMVDKELYSTRTGARALRFNCTDLGTATTIDAEVSGAQL